MLQRVPLTLRPCLRFSKARVQGGLAGGVSPGRPSHPRPRQDEGPLSGALCPRPPALGVLLLQRTSMAISTAFKRLADYQRRHGLRSTIQRAGLAARQALFANRMILFYCDLSAQTEPAALPSALKVERKTSSNEISPEDLNQIVSVWNAELARRNMEERFRLGASLWLIKCDGKLAGYGWTLRGRTVEPHYFPLAQDDVHLFDFTVFQQYRGRGINPILVASILHSLAAEGAGRAFIEAAEWNQAQLSSLSKTPFRRLGRARKLTISRATVVQWTQDGSVVPGTAKDLKPLCLWEKAP